MKVNYKVLAYRPEAEFIAIEFTHPDRPDEPWVKQFEFPDFTRQEKLMDQIRAVASRIAGQWERIQEHPAELAIPETGQVDVVPELYLPYEPNPQYEEEPDGITGRRNCYPATSKAQRRRRSHGSSVTSRQKRLSRSWMKRPRQYAWIETGP